MSKSLTKKSILSTYADLLGQIKTRIQQGQTRAVMAANAEMVLMYWEIGQMLDENQKKEGWGKQIIPRLAKDILNELPEVKGFSERNLGRMRQGNYALNFKFNEGHDTGIYSYEHLRKICPCPECVP